jgi:hypothetical protein
MQFVLQWQPHPISSPSAMKISFYFELRGLVIIIIIIITLGMSFKLGIRTYIPETNHVPREHCVAAILM